MSIALDDLPDSWRSAQVNSFWDDLEIIDETDGDWSVPTGGLYLNKIRGEREMWVKHCEKVVQSHFDLRPTCWSKTNNFVVRFFETVEINFQSVCCDRW